MIWGVIVSIYTIIVQRETTRSGAAIVRVKDNEVEYLLTNLALRVSIPYGYATKALDIRGPFEEDMMPNTLLTCQAAGSKNASMVLVGGMDTCWKPGGGRMSERSSLLSDDASSSSSETVTS